MQILQCNQRGHSFRKCPNDSIGGRSIEYSMQNREPTRCNVANRMETVDSYSVKRGQHTPYPVGVKPKENWEAVGDTLYSPSSRPGVPSTSGTSGVIPYPTSSASRPSILLDAESTCSLLRISLQPR